MHNHKPYPCISHLYMLNHPVLIRLTQIYPVRIWAWVVSLSFVAAVCSALVLAVSVGVKLPEPLAAWYDRSEVFVRDTIRLTFKTAKHSGEMTEMVYMAPPGILEEKRNFTWLQDVAAAATAAVSSQHAAVEANPKKIKTPGRLLEPDWQPDFSTH